jgi:hypothetical protein
MSISGSLASVDEEGVGETSGRRPDRVWSGSAARMPIRKKNKVSSFGADPLFGLQFCQGVTAAVRSGPDVFADALVPF